MTFNYATFYQKWFKRIFSLNRGSFTIDEKNSNVGAGFIPARNAINSVIRAGINPAPTKNSPQLIEMLRLSEVLH